jgi:hypothetical protein
MRDIVGEACEAVQAAATGKSKVAVCCQPGRIGVLKAEDAGAYLPLVRAVHAQDKVVAATADIRATAGHLLPATVRAVSYRSDTGDRS